MREFARSFYKSTAWKKCSEAYKKSKGYLCEACLAEGKYTPGEIVHHKIHIDPVTINDPQVLTDFANLELLCRKHHAKAHPEIYGKHRKRYVVDEYGHVIARDDSEIF